MLEYVVISTAGRTTVTAKSMRFEEPFVVFETDDGPVRYGQYQIVKVVEQAPGTGAKQRTITVM